MNFKRLLITLACILGSSLQTWAAEKPQHSYDTTGRLLCAVHGRPGVYSREIVRINSPESAYSLAIEINGIVYLSTEVGHGAFGSRQFKEREWIIGDPVRVSLDESKARIYLQNPKGKEIDLGYTQRIHSEHWEGCRAMADSMRHER
jgi:hypothetical protein